MIMASLTRAMYQTSLRSNLLSHRFLVRQSNSVIIPSSTLVDRRDVHLTSVRKSFEKGHSTHWIAERAVAIGLFAVIPAAYVVPPCFAMDTALTASLVLHAHWGISGVFGDYMHGYPSETGERRLPILTTLSKALPLVLSITAMACLTSFNYNDVGLVNAIAMLWRV